VTVEEPRSPQDRVSKAGTPAWVDGAVKGDVSRPSAYLLSCNRVLSKIAVRPHETTSLKRHG